MPGLLPGERTSPRLSKVTEVPTVPVPPSTARLEIPLPVSVGATLRAVELL